MKGVAEEGGRGKMRMKGRQLKSEKASLTITGFENGRKGPYPGDVDGL